MVRFYSKRITGVNHKVDAVIQFLSTGVYRFWFWQHYKIASKQEELRRAWREVCFKFELKSIEQGLLEWVEKNGAGCPPDPAKFAEFIAPKLTPEVDAFIRESKANLL